MHPSKLARFLLPLKGKEASWSPTARIERAHSHRARSASKKDGLAASYPIPLRLRSASTPINAPSKLARFSLRVGGLDWPLTAPVERSPSEGARSGSKKGHPGYSLFPPFPVRRPSKTSEVATEPSLAGSPILTFLDPSVRMAKVGTTDPPEKP